MDDLDKWRAARGGEFVYEDQTGRQAGGPFSEADTLGRKQLRRLGVPDYLLLIARTEPGRVRRIPSSAIAEEGVDDEGEFSLVGCPCGAHLVVRSALQKCTGCERWYVHVELGSVYVAYGGMTAPPLPVV